MMYREEGTRQIVYVKLNFSFKPEVEGETTQKFSHTSHYASGNEINIYCVRKFNIISFSLVRLDSN